MLRRVQRVERGEPKEQIDEAALAFGMPMGPIELMDTVGLDVCAHVGKIMKLGPAGPTKLDDMVAAGKLGRKIGRGLLHLGERQAREGRAREALGQVELERLGRELVKPLIREAEKVRDEKVVASADLVDMGVIFGTGFAPFLGGPLQCAANEQKSNVEVFRRTAAE